MKRYCMAHTGPFPFRGNNAYIMLAAQALHEERKPFGMNTIIVCQKNEQQSTLPSAFSGKRSALSESKDCKQRRDQNSCKFIGADS
jgi:hypothetical protein